MMVCAGLVTGMPSILSVARVLAWWTSMPFGPGAPVRPTMVTEGVAGQWSRYSWTAAAVRWLAKPRVARVAA